MLRSVLTVFAFLLFAMPASANTITSHTFGFECLTSARSCPSGEADVELSVSAGGAGEVVFTLDFVGTSVFQMQAVYFETNTLLASLVSATNTTDVAFVIGPHGNVPTSLVGGGAFSWSPIVSTTGTVEDQTGYLDSGEQLVIVASLAQGVTADAIAAAIGSGAFRVGIFLADDGLITVPEPLLLGLLGVAGLAFAGRKRSA